MRRLNVSDPSLLSAPAQAKDSVEPLLAFVPDSLKGREIGSRPSTHGEPPRGILPALMTAEVTPSPDLKLAERCTLGDRAAQRELFQRERRHVHATLYRILGSNQHMDDLLQETFIAAFRALPTFRGEAKLSTWIDRIAVRVAFSHIRARRGQPSLEVVPEMAADDADAEERALAREAARHLYAALDKMDEKLRVAFSLHVLDGRPLLEVAAAMDATLVATKTRVFRARRALEAAARRDPVLAGMLGDGAAKTTARAPEEDGGAL